MPTVKDPIKKETSSLDPLKGRLFSTKEIQKTTQGLFFKASIFFLFLGILVQGILIYQMHQKIRFLEAKVEQIPFQDIFPPFPPEEVIEPLLNPPLPVV